MSQKRLRKIKKEKVVELQTESIGTKYLGFWEIIKGNWILLVLISILVAVVFVNGMAADFVSDDYASITQNPLLGDFGEMIKNPATFTNYVIFKFFGYGSSIPYHLTSLLMYIVFIWLTYVVLFMVFNNKWLATVAVLIFSIHPMHVEAVTWISGRIYLIVSISIMLAFVFFIYFIRKKNWRWITLTGLVFLFGFLTDKPRPFSLFMIILLYFVYVGFEKLKIDWKKFLLVILGIAAVFLILALPQINLRITSVNSGYNLSESVFYNPFFQYPTGLTKYLQLLLVPIDLTLYHTMYTFPVWLNWLVFLNFMIALGYFYFKNKGVFFAMGFVLAGVLPSMAPLKVSWLVAERYIFLGSLGFCLLIAFVLQNIWKKSKLVSVSLVAVIMVLGSARIILRNIDWQTNHNLWVNTCQVSPNSHNAWNNIGDDYDKLAQYDNAVKGFTQSTVVKPNYADAYHNRANIFFKTGRLDLARDSYNTALSYSPGLFQTYFSLTQIDLMENRIDLALEHSQKALQLQQNNPQAWYIFGVVNAQSGRIEEAKKIFKAIVSKYPDYKPAVDALIGLNEKKNKRVMIINPPGTIYGDGVLTSSIPLGLLYLTSYLKKKKINVKFYDALASGIRRVKKVGSGRRYGVSRVKIVSEIKRFKPDIVGIGTMFTAFIDDSLEVAKIVKEVNKDIMVVFGGSHVSIDPVEVMKNKWVDVAVYGEGEKTIEELATKDKLSEIKGIVYRKHNRVVKNAPRELVKNLDDLPFPAWDELDLSLYGSGSAFSMRKPVFPIISSRGCPGHCLYCSVNSVWQHRWRGRSAVNVVEEIEMLIKNYGVKEFMFLDDSMSVDANRLERICDEIVKRKLDIKWTTPNGVAHWTLTKPLLKKMKKAGCYRITFGIESGDMNIRRWVGKPYSLEQARKLTVYANKIGMWTLATYIIGFPYENKENVNNTYNFALKSDVDLAFLFRLGPRIGTPIYEIFRKEGWLIKDKRILYSENVACRTKYFSGDEIVNIQNRFYKNFIIKRWLTPVVLFRIVKKIRSWEDFNYVIRIGLIGIKLINNLIFSKIGVTSETLKV